ncbi:hypothetical protein BFAG_00995 [Bacteroides fragilis 3_1_12]|uniref:Uncharacterized protein n=1 Tax=Bacteroides fragilis 3_1_12 TaxID=457424 RepID=A0ABN0BHJ3_BACFG|nr:hypothetical protein BFAG_00995 [Bacteroides fragilis 3_1_12]
MVLLKFLANKGKFFRSPKLFLVNLFGDLGKFSVSRKSIQNCNVKIKFSCYF